MKKRVYLWGLPEAFENYRRAVEAAGGQAVFGAGAEDCDALLLAGGGDLEPWRYGQEDRGSRGLDPQRDQEELALLERFAAAGKPVLGVCRGLQTINVCFGGTLLQDIPDHSAVEGKDRLHAVRTAPSVFRELYGPSLTVNSAHHQAVDRLGAGLLAVQWSEDGIVEALVHQSLPVWAVQWHPERLGETGARLFAAFLSR